MIGAILGDIVGSPYEFDKASKVKDFTLFDQRCEFTDDTVMTLAVANALCSISSDASEDEIKSAVITSMQETGKRYPDRGYGARFISWLFSDNPKPYNSYGNGSAMRVSSVGWLYSTLERTLEVARYTAEVTHNHPEGIKGAESVAAAIFLARKGCEKKEIKSYMEKFYNYDLSRTIDQIRPYYHHVESCQETVPEALTAFFEGKDFEDVVRTAVSLGGDADTLTAIAASIAEAYYPVSKSLYEKAKSYLDSYLKSVLEKIDERIALL